MSPEGVLQLLEEYPQSWEINFQEWLDRDHNLELVERAILFKSKLQEFGAHRPYKILGTEEQMNNHPGPYLDGIMRIVEPMLIHFGNYDLTVNNPITEEHEAALSELYDALRGLRYDPTTYEDRPSIMVISKAIHLLTDGRVGPAFDSKVRNFMAIGNIETVEEWIDGLNIARQDVIDFEQTNNCSLLECVPVRFQHLFRGRIYDMIAVTA